MSGLMLCNKQSDTPYEIKESNLKIYSIEELAYYLHENAYFVDESFFTEDLVQFIDEKLGLPKVAIKLKYALGQKMNFSELILVIVKESLYYTSDEVKELEKELHAISSKSVPERMKTRAEKLLENGKLSSAMKTYQKILNNNLLKKQDNSFYASIYEGMGRILCRLFQFRAAIEWFQKAYELDENKTYLRDIIMTKLIEAGGAEQEVELMEEVEKNPELVQKCKEEFQSVKEEIKNSTEYEQLKKVFVYDGRRNIDDYYEGVQEILDQWKRDYKEDIA